MISLFFLGALLLMILGLPIAVSVGFVSILYILLHDIPVHIISQKLLSGINMTALLAIPLFILAGDLMGKGGLAQRIIKLASSLVGNIRGGLAIVAIMGCMFFAAISGSGVATAAAMGSIMIPYMVQNGYNQGFASSVIAGASPLGVIIPPSITFIIFGTLSGASVADLYKAGIPAGLIMGVALCILAYFMSKNQGGQIRGNHSFSWKEVFLALKDSIWALGTPFILVGGVFGGIFTPTESAIAAVVYALFVGLFIYKDMKLKELGKIFIDSTIITSKIMFIIANASLFAWVLTYEEVPQMIVEFFLSFSSNPIIILLIINVIVLILGAFMETSAILVIVVPLFLPIILQLGIDPVHFGIIITINTAIGLVTPPFGVCLFTVSSVGKVSIQQVIRYITVPLIVMIAILLLIRFVE